MSRLRSGVILLLLAIPFALYGAWQARTISHLDGNDPVSPGQKKLPGKDQLAAARIKSEKLTGEVRALEAVALQFRQPTASDRVDDEVCKALLKEFAARSADLTDLDKFLSDVSAPKYAGALKSKYEDWQKSKESLAAAAKAIEDWFANSAMTIDGPEAAVQAVAGFQQLLSKYSADGRFADRNRIAAWKALCRVEVMKALENAAREPFAKVLNLPLPLPAESESADVKKALGAPRAIREQMRLLKNELDQIEESRITLPERAQREVKAARSRADDWAAKEALLALFADPEPLTAPARAAEWLARIDAEFRKTQVESERGVFRKKVQQFCDAFIPASARLDAFVLIKGDKVPRSGVSIDYASDAGTKRLTDSLNDVNELNFTTRYPNPDRIVWANGNKFTGTFSVLQPTAKSLVARDFALARAGLTLWSAQTVAQLKKKCEGADRKVDEQEVRRGLVDELVGVSPAGVPGRLVWTAENSRIWMRLNVLADAMGKFPALFESAH